MAKEHVHGVFEEIARGYDAANDRISLGQHRTWKAALVRAALGAAQAEGACGRVVDLCCGTGDITALCAAKAPGVGVVGLDFSAEMLAVAAERTKAMSNVALIEGNAMDLPLNDDSCDAAVISFGLRNTPDYDQVVREMVRVVRPGGIVACLDASVPENPLVRPFYILYYKLVMPLLGGGFKNRKEYDWLYQSTQEFLRKDELVALFERNGLEDVWLKTWTFGAAALHIGTVPVAE